MTEKTVKARVRKLNIPKDAKDALLRLCKRSKELVLSILRFIRRHRDMSETLVLGAIISFLLAATIPVIGGFLALLALVSSAAIALARQWKSELSSVFGETATT